MVFSASPRLVQCIEYPAHLGIHKSDGGIVSLNGLPTLGLGEAPVEGVGKERFAGILGGIAGRVGGEFDFIVGVEVKVFFWSNVGAVGTEKTYGQKKRLICILFHKPNGLRGHHAVGLFFVGTFGGQKRQRRPKPRLGVRLMT